MANKIWKNCDRGHRFQKSSDCPICPICWSAYYKNKFRNDFPKSLSAPALRALLHKKITNLRLLTKYTEREISDLHGMGPKGIKMLKSALTRNGLTFSRKK